MSTANGGEAESEERGAALVLVVDDTPAILSAWPRLLAGLPIRLCCLQSAEEALAAIHREVPAVLISDQQMPHMTGLELLAVVRARWPAIRFGLHTSDLTAQSVALCQGVPVLEKSATIETLQAFVAQLLPGRIPAPGRDASC